MVTTDDIPNPNTLGIKTILNGKAVQDWNTNDMIFDVPTLIEFLSGSTTLFAGTVILTGTPQGVACAKPPLWLAPGTASPSKSTRSVRLPIRSWKSRPKDPPEGTGSPLPAAALAPSRNLVPNH